MASFVILKHIVREASVHKLQVEIYVSSLSLIFECAFVALFP